MNGDKRKETKKRMNNMVQRGITGTIFVAVLVAAIWLHPMGLGLFFLLVTVLGLLEFFRLSRKDEAAPQVVLGLAAGVGLFVASHANAFHSAPLWVLFLPLLAVLAMPLVELYRGSARPFVNLAYTLWGVAYVAIPFSLLPQLAVAEGGGFSPQVVMGIFILIWTNDTGAYLVGSQIGRRRLFERVSPKKSWEGTLGGGLFAMLAGWLVSHGFTSLSPGQWIAAGALVAIFGTYGDLVESLFKRSIQVKDSGNILPGHGGILDRFDSVLFAAPVIFIFLHLVLPLF